MSRKATKSGVWKLAKEYNRRKRADPHTGLVKCVSCPTIKHYKEMDTGHWIPRTRGKSVYYDPMNLEAQCQSCNCYNKEEGKIGYTLFMEREYGSKKVDALIKASREIVRGEQEDLEHWRNYYREKLA